MIKQNIITKGLDVIVVYKANATQSRIYKVKHNNIEYLVDKIGFTYDKKVGEINYHIFGVQSGETFLKLIFNTKTLTWKLLEIDFAF